MLIKIALTAVSVLIIDLLLICIVKGFYDEQYNGADPPNWFIATTVIILLASALVDVVCLFIKIWTA